MPYQKYKDSNYFTVDDFELFVTYVVEMETDPLGTGDSPTSWTVEITRIETTCNNVDIMEHLNRATIEDLTEQILEQERD